MSTFKSPELHICGRIKTVTDLQTPQESSFYIKANIIEGEDWKIIFGNAKFQTFETEANYGVAPIEQPFNIHYVTQNIRGWPRMIIEVWKVDKYGRHNLHGYGTMSVPTSSGDYDEQICCWRPMGTWYDRFIGASSQLQYPSIIASPLNRYSLRTFSSCVAQVEFTIIARNFQLHGILSKP